MDGAEQFKECPTCAAKAGSPILCDDCLRRRAAWDTARRNPVEPKYDIIDKNPDRCPFCGEDELNYMLTEDFVTKGGDKLELTEVQCNNETCRLSFWV